jgi:predicted dehydrogenase
MRTYRVAVIGAGDRGKKYSTLLKEYPNIKLENVCDIDKERCSKAMEEFGFENSFSDYRDAVDKSEIDFVVVCTPAFFHAEISTYAMNNKKHVICEKPMDLSFERAAFMVACAKRNDVVLTIGHQYHNFRIYRKLKKAFDENIIGRPVMMRFSDIRSIRPKLAMHDAEFGNGGPMTDMSCHYTDLMRWFLTAEPVSVSAKYLVLAKNNPSLSSIANKAPDAANITITFDSGDIGVIFVCWGLPKMKKSKQEYDAFGPLGLLEITDGDKVTAHLENDETKEYELTQSDIEETKIPEKVLVDSFIDSIEKTGEQQIKAEDALKALSVTMAAIQSLNLDRPVTIKEIYTNKPSIFSSMNAGK